MLFAAFLGAGARTFRDVSGRKRVYWLVAAITVVAALGSALSPSFWGADRVPFPARVRCGR
jgi:hypothetical protein